MKHVAILQLYDSLKVNQRKIKASHMNVRNTLETCNFKVYLYQLGVVKSNSINKTVAVEVLKL